MIKLSNRSKDFIKLLKNRITSNRYDIVLDIMVNYSNLSEQDREQIINVFNSLGIDLLNYCGFNALDFVEVVGKVFQYPDADGFLDLINSQYKNIYEYIPDSQVQDTAGYILEINWKSDFSDIACTILYINKENKEKVTVVSYKGLKKMR